MMGTMRVAAVQMVPVIADVDANLAAAERLVDEAAAGGAEWVILPEFFTTGATFDERLADASLPPDGAATDVLIGTARRHGITVGGSFLCRDGDGHVRNAFLLASPEGRILGRHDKDLPTMWENSFYVGGSDDGIIAAGDLTVGAAVCWEYMRTQTARRLRGKVDLVVGGSNWWSIPAWAPRAVFSRLEARNAALATSVAERFAAHVGAPVIHAAHAGPIECPMPWVPGLKYSGHLEGGAVIADAYGQVLARRQCLEGAGVAIAELEIPAARTPPTAEIPDRFWLHRRQLLPAFAWTYQRAHGRRWYRSHVAHRLRATSPREL